MLKVKCWELLSPGNYDKSSSDAGIDIRVPEYGHCKPVREIYLLHLLMRLSQNPRTLG
jgi:hypothetical protein